MTINKYFTRTTASIVLSSSLLLSGCSSESDELELLNQPPEINSAENFSVIEGAQNGQLVYTSEGVDADGDKISWALEDSQSAFEIDSVTGELTVTDSSKLVSSLPSYTITVIATDDAIPNNTTHMEITVTVEVVAPEPEPEPVNQSPEITSPALFSVKEDAVNGTLVYRATGTDADENNISWSLTDSLSIFAVDATSGELTVSDATQLVSTLTDYTITITATDDGEPNMMATVELAVTVIAKNTVPTITSEASLAVLQGVDNGNLVYTATATDAEDNQISWSIEDNLSAFDIDANSGEVYVDDTSKLVSTLDGHTIKITATDDAVEPLSTDLMITVKVLAPECLPLDSNQVTLINNPCIKFGGSTIVDNSEHPQAPSVMLRRFSKTIVDENNALASPEQMFNSKQVKKALSTTGVTMRFKTSSQSIAFNFVKDYSFISDPSSGPTQEEIDNKKVDSSYGKFAIEIDGVVVDPYQSALVPNRNTGELILTSNDDLVHEYKLIFPIWENPILESLTLDQGGNVEQLETVDKPIYVAIGDSISHGQKQTYSTETWPWLVADYLGHELYNIAVGGSKTGVLQVSQIANIPSVDLVTILWGYNDIHSLDRTAIEYKEEMTAVYDEVRKHHPETQIVLMPLLTAGAEGTHPEATPENIELEIEYRTTLRELFDELSASDANLQLIDSDTFTATTDLAEGDNVHLSIYGASKLAAKVASAIYGEEEHFPTPAAPEPEPAPEPGDMLLSYVPAGGTTTFYAPILVSEGLLSGGNTMLDSGFEVQMAANQAEALAACQTKGLTLPTRSQFDEIVSANDWPADWTITDWSGSTSKFWSQTQGSKGPGYYAVYRGSDNKIFGNQAETASLLYVTCVD